MKKHVLLLFALLNGFISTSQTLPAYLPSNGLVGWWPFNGNANDESGNGNNGVVNGATLTQDRFGVPDKAFSFDGTDITIPIPNSVFQSNFTISVYAQLTSFYSQCSGPCYPTFLQGENCFFDLNFINSIGYANNQNGIGFSFSQGCSVGQWSGGVNRAIDPFTWSNVTIVGNNSLIYLYVNGQLVDLTENPVINQSNTLGSFIKIGFGSWSYQYFIGLVDDLAIYNRALSHEEIVELIGGEIQQNTCTNIEGPLFEGLLGFWPLCGNAQDISGNQNHGLAVGTTPASDRFNNPTGALYFNNQLNYDKDWVKLSIDSSLVDSDYSISLWTKLNTNNLSLYPSPASYPAIIEGDQCYLTTTYDLYSPGYGILGYYESGSCSSAPSGPIWLANVNPQEWLQTVIVSKNDTTSLYINGDLAITVESTNQNLGIGHFLKLGRGHVSQDLSIFNGWIDDLAIHNRALSADEVQQLYTLNACTFTIYDTVTVNNYVTVYDTVSVSTADTLIINTLITAVQPAQENTFLVYPNPAHTQITIDNGNLSILGGYSIRIVNSATQEVYNAPISQQIETILLNGWGGNGLYVLYIVDPQQQIVAVKQIVLE
jgi:hypothetical protein